MTEKILGKITHAEFGIDKDYPFLIGLQLRFSFCGSAISDGKKYMLSVEMNSSEHAHTIIENFENVCHLLTEAKVHYVSELVGKPVQITLEKHTFKDFRILTEVL